METAVTLVLGGIVGFAIIMYVLLDGFDLGIGIIFPWVKSEEERSIMIATILPVWDGNETWLVLGGATLYGAFPIVYSTLLPILYMPIIIMLAALVFRGVSFEFMHSAHTTRFLWTFFFSIGSLVAAFCQGVMLGTFIEGYNYMNGIIDPHYKWLTPFSMVCGIAVVYGYALLGATWLIAKTTGELQDAMFHRAKILLIAVAMFMMVVSLWTPHIDPSISQRWFSLPNFFILLPLPMISFIVFVANWRCLQIKREFLPFYLSMTLFLLAYLGFAISVWPYLIPRTVTLWQAAAPLSSQLFILVGLVILLPVLIGYTIFSYRVFKGKVISYESLHY